MKWRERLAQRPSLRQFERWPVIGWDSLHKEQRKGFLRNQRIVQAVLDGNSLRKVAERFSLSESRISQILNRCLGGNDAEPPLTQALIPYGMVTPKQRKRPLPTFTQPSGTTGSFKVLLQIAPGLARGLDDFIIAKLKDADYAQRLKLNGFFGEFKRLLSEAHWPVNCYPYTTDKCAYESVRVYFHDRVDALTLERLRPIKAPIHINNTQPLRPLRAIQIDGHTLDLSNHIHLQLNDELIPLRLSRACVLVAVDVDTHCILGYHLALTRIPNHQDMLSLIDRCIHPWKPLKLITPGFSYTPGACFPSGFAESFPISFGTVQLDNALTNHSHAVSELLCEQFGATMHYGFPAMPTVRALIESVFKYISEHGTHRFAATSGSYPTDPIKESRKNRKRIPTTCLRTLDEALSLLLTEYNVRNQVPLGSPQELFQHLCKTKYIRYEPKYAREQYELMTGMESRPIHCDQKKAYINFYYDRYQGPGLQHALKYEKKIIVRFYRKDIRTLQAYSVQGMPLGLLYCSPPWRRFAHSLPTRQVIYHHYKKQHFHSRDLLAGYLRMLLENKGKPQIALQLLRVYDEFTQDSPQGLYLGSNFDQVDEMNLENTHNSFAWNPEFANHRGHHE